MVEDGPDGRDGGFESLVAALRRANRQVGIAVGHGVEGLQNWVGKRWMPMRLLILGGFSWGTSWVFGWLLGQVVEFGSWLAALLMGIAVSSISVRQILIFFFMVYLFHSGIQTKLILVIKTILEDMDSNPRSDVRTDGGNSEDFSSRLGALCGMIAGATLGWSFGMDGVFVGAGIGWGLGDELDRRFEAKVNEAGHVPEEERGRVEKQ